MKYFKAPSLHTGRALLGPAWFSIAEGRVAEVGEGVLSTPDATDLEGTVVPGLVDIHCHGRWNVSFDRDDPDDVASMVARCWGRGLTSVIATLATAPLHDLRARLSALSPLVHDGILAGIHLEGPYLAQSRRGAHAEHLLRDPDVAEIESLLLAADGTVRMVTIAPERPGAMEAIDYLVSQGVVVALGHSDASADETRRAIDAGATVATHLFNGMRSIGHRELGIAGECLLDTRMTLELIADGRHVHPKLIDMVLRLARDRVAFVSDSMPATCAGDGRYELAGSAIDVIDGVARSVETGSLAGSTTPLDLLCRDNWPRALDSFGSYTSVPADALGLDRVGTLEPGSSADLMVIDDAGRYRSMRRGVWLSSQDAGEP